ncbi:sigma-70 family RNA polymerase sigma factor [Elizabethkingia anophelis]|uniref:RNA polymerase sigma-70 factor (ECF subfamily) n=4 Tax=Elizabethkingia TaxID=308865 RepID=A0ABD5B2K7_ELIMR|nr:MULTISPECIES: sigma-70 family RNA polymerase sigma factor [Elizabethkingia]AIL44766.1 RNA polymerase ECF-type sigma factor [Elizabethkingia anophelis NUHP1]ATC37588.1 sigma-70 family RNA polymerase sigma factor [Elizabethkingia anophelis R26]ATC41267.1 sigma-70 family RNA polymerase sigma factor [Elizabethkingia anophelis Ag1]ATC44944.1 sigma-70 family RNA polymerase sigma factor [Elizabethkingia anophelis]ATC48620.1 sigma-70 family RNA polymerase sigma factor [Elizabethkingia anophelis]
MGLKEKEFLEKIEKHKGMIFKISKMYLENQEDREDLFQEIILQLWKSYQAFEGKSQFSTWLYRVSLNTAITFLKRDKKRTDKNELHENIDIEDEQNTDKELQTEFLYKAVQELNPIEKALIFLFLEGQNHKQISENMGITEVNARVKLNRTKEKLQQIIKNYGYEF